MSCHPFSAMKAPPAGPRICVIDPAWRVREPASEGYFFLAQQLLRSEQAWNNALDRAAEKRGFILDNGAFEAETITDVGVLASLYGELLEAGAGSKWPMVVVAPDFPAESMQKTLYSYEKLCDRLGTHDSVMIVPQSQRGDEQQLIEAFAAAAAVSAQWVGVSILAAPIAYAPNLPHKLAGKETRELCRRKLIRTMSQRCRWPEFPNVHLLGLGADTQWVAGYAPMIGANLRSIDSHKPAARIRNDGMDSQRAFSLRDNLIHHEADVLRHLLWQEKVGCDES